MNCHVDLRTGLLRGLLGLAAVALALPAAAEMRLVPQSYSTIQAALDAAQPGDVVLVADGVYSGPGNRDLNFMGKGVTLRSQNGPENCIISGADAQAHGVIVFNHNETDATVVDGFTITGGNQFNGGGIHILSGSPIIQNCIITGNSCDCWGAGVYSQSSGTPLVRNCVISGNQSAAEGGGVFTISSTTRFENCIIAGNTANLGGGVCVFGGFSEFVNCRITDNIATGSGGGGYVYEGTLTNCTVAGNSAVWEAAGLYAWGNVSTITNSIVWGNTGAEQILGQPAVSYSIIEGGMGGVGNLSADPAFVDALGGDYRLASGSPAIDAGNNAAVPAGVVTDAAGSPRFLNDPKTADTGVGPGRVVDIGAFEFGPARAGGVLR